MANKTMFQWKDIGSNGLLMSALSLCALGVQSMVLSVLQGADLGHHHFFQCSAGAWGGKRTIYELSHKCMGSIPWLRCFSFCSGCQASALPCTRGVRLLILDSNSFCLATALMIKSLKHQPKKTQNLTVLKRDSFTVNVKLTTVMDNTKHKSCMSASARYFRCWCIVHFCAHLFCVWQWQL